MTATLRRVAVVLLLAAGVLYAAPAPPGIHRVQDEHYRHLAHWTEAEFDAIRPEVSAPETLQHGPLKKTVFGWHPYWMGTAYTDYDYSLLSTVGYFAYAVDIHTGNPANLHSWPTTDLVPYAQARGTKVVLTATCFGTTENRTLLSNPTARTNLIHQLIVQVQARGADGVNIDFEEVPGDMKNNLTGFLRDLTTRMHAAIPGSEVSVALPAVDWSDAFDVDAYNSFLDYSILMGYNYHYSGSGNAGPVGTLYISPGNNWWLSIQDSVNRYLNKGILRSKFIVGVPYYGLDWPTQSHAINAGTTGSGTARFYTSCKTYAAQYGRRWEGDSKTPYVLYGGYRQLWYDDAESLGYKCDFINAENLAGLGIWALGYDGTHPELWEVIEDKFTDPDPCAGADNAAWDGVQSPADGTRFFPGDAYTAQWRMANSGASTWSAACSHHWAHIGGEGFGAGSPIGLGAATVVPGDGHTWTAAMTAPATPGVYTSVWRMQRSGTGFGESRSLVIEVIPDTGFLSVTVAPSDAVATGAQWRVDGGAWRASGDTVADLPVGVHTVSWRSVNGWIAPDPIPVTIQSGTFSVQTGVYARKTGSVTVSVLPATGLPEVPQWRLGAGPWRAFGDVVSNVPEGMVSLSYLDLDGWITPAADEVFVPWNSLASVTAVYIRKTGALQVTLDPPEATTAGARWRADTGPWLMSGTLLTNLPTGPVSISFLPADRWMAPSTRTADIAWTSRTELAATFTFSNQPPVIRLESGVRVSPGHAASVAFGIDDPEGDAWSWTLPTAPSGSLHAVTGTNGWFQWTPPDEAAGSTVLWAVAATDLHGAAATATCAMTVGTPPGLPTLGTLTGLVFQPLETSWPVVEPDEDAVEAVSLDGPTGAVWSVEEGQLVFRYTPDPASWGRVVTSGVEVWDRDGSVRTAATIQVRALPAWTHDRFVRGAVGAWLFVPVSATDPDGAAVVVSPATLPNSASFSSHGGSGLFTFRPEASDDRSMVVATFLATDNDGVSTGILAVAVGPVAADGDGDGMPDDWEWEHYGSTTSALPLLDEDGDRHTTSEEAIAGTDPHDAASVLTLSPEPPASASMAMQWPGVAGRRYHLREAAITGGPSIVLTTRDSAESMMATGRLERPVGLLYLEVEVSE